MTERAKREREQEQEQERPQTESQGKTERVNREKRTAEEKKLLTNRLNKIEGQVRGIGRMIERDDYCMDVLVQVTAAVNALNSFSRLILSDHLRTTVAWDLENGSDEKVMEVVDALQRYVK